MWTEAGRSRSEHVQSSRARGPVGGAGGGAAVAPPQGEVTVPIKAVRGVRDILPAEAPRWQRVEAAARRVFEAYGYREIRLPLFERTELFARGIGSATDIVQKEMYTFEDRSGESVTLRPDATASLLRAYIEHGFQVEPKAERLELHVNSIGDAATRPAYRAKLLDYFSPRSGELCAECRGRLERNPLRVLDCKTPGCQPVIEKAPSILDSLTTEAAEHFERVRACLDAMGIVYAVNPRLVRGLDYYVRTTFEVLTTELGAQNAVAGGGRYDGLIEQLDGPPDPGIGFAIGLERVVLLLGDGESTAVPVVVLIPLGNAALSRLLGIARDARRRGARVDLGYGTRKLPRELERANRLGAGFAVIVGDNELARGQALLREMKSGEQRAVPLEGLADELVGLAGRRG